MVRCTKFTVKTSQDGLQEELGGVMVEYIMIENQEQGKFLNLVVGQNKDIAYSWVFNTEDTTPILNLFSRRKMLEELGFREDRYVWHRCNQYGEIL